MTIVWTETSLIPERERDSLVFCVCVCATVMKGKGKGKCLRNSRVLYYLLLECFISVCVCVCATEFYITMLGLG